MRSNCNQRDNLMQRYQRAVVMLLPIVTLWIPPTSAQSMRARSGLPNVAGTRVGQADAAPGVSPMGRIPNRLQTRIDSRITHNVDVEGNASRRNGLRSFQQAVRNQTDTIATTRTP